MEIFSSNMIYMEIFSRPRFIWILMEIFSSNNILYGNI